MIIFDVCRNHIPVLKRELTRLIPDSGESTAQ